MKRRIWCILLAAPMVMGLLSGCGPGSGDVVIEPGVEGKIINVYI